MVYKCEGVCWVKLNIQVSIYICQLTPVYQTLSFHGSVAGAGEFQSVCEEEASFWCGRRWAEHSKCQQGQKQAVSDGG